MDKNEGYPTELLEVPTPLVALLGEVKHHPALIRAVEAVNRETQAVPTLRFVSLPREHSFPPKKDTRDRMGSTTKRYESLVVSGVLKTTWLHKHHRVLPAVAAAVFPYNSKCGPAEWDVAVTMVSDVVDKLRRELGGRECRVVVLMVDDGGGGGAAAAPGADEQEDRMGALRRRCDLDSKTALLLRTADFGGGAGAVAGAAAAVTPPVRRLELGLRTMAFDYYQTQAKRVKKNRKHVGRASLALLIRHSFKVAHFYEFRRQTDKMLKHYALAYKLATELLPTREGQVTLGTEQVKGVADVLNYKLCSHRMAALQTKEAVAQFETHTRTFRSAVGAPGSEYRHWHWFSRQHMVFAQLLEQLHLRGGNAVSHHALGGMLHPGFFFANAARFAKRRRTAAQALGLYGEGQQQGGGGGGRGSGGGGGGGAAAAAAAAVAERLRGRRQQRWWCRGGGGAGGGGR